MPAVEVHLSAVDEREEWRRNSVIRDLCVGSVQGKGVDGYREALELLKGALDVTPASTPPAPTAWSSCCASASWTRCWSPTS